MGTEAVAWIRPSPAPRKPWPRHFGSSTPPGCRMENQWYLRVPKQVYNKYNEFQLYDIHYMVSVLEGWNIPIVCMHAAIKLKQISCTIGTMRPTQKLPQPCSLLGFFSSSLASLLSPTPSVHALPSLLAFHFLPYSSYPCWLSFSCSWVSSLTNQMTMSRNQNFSFSCSCCFSLLSSSQSSSFFSSYPKLMVSDALVQHIYDMTWHYSYGVEWCVAGHGQTQCLDNIMRRLWWMIPNHKTHNKVRFKLFQLRFGCVLSQWVSRGNK